MCGNDTAIRLEDVAGPLLAYVRDLPPDPERIARAVDLVNTKIDARNRGDASTARVAALRAEVAQVEGEVGNLVDALARGRAYDAIQAALEARDRRLQAGRAELEALTLPAARGATIPRVSADDVRARLAALWEDVRQLDGDRARMALRASRSGRWGAAGKPVGPWKCKRALRLDSLRARSCS